MTKKEFELIAHAIRVARIDGSQQSADAQNAIHFLSRIMAQLLKQTNDRFDVDRFLEATR